MNDVYTATLDLKTGKLLVPPSKVTQRFVGTNTAPDWSPDGKYLAYISQRGPSPGLGSKIISIRSLKTGEEHEISPKLNYIFNRLRWSPDGRSLLVTGRDKKGRQGIYQIDAQTSNVTPIVQSDLGVYGPEWSPDGRGIFYRRSESSTKKTSIVVRDLGTGGEKELYGAFGSSFLGHNLPLSPDGGQLAFTINDQATRSSILKVMIQALARLLPPTPLAQCHSFP